MSINPFVSHSYLQELFSSPLVETLKAERLLNYQQFDQLKMQPFLYLLSRVKWCSVTTDKFTGSLLNIANVINSCYQNMQQVHSKSFEDGIVHTSWMHVLIFLHQLYVTQQILEMLSEPRDGTYLVRTSHKVTCNPWMQQSVVEAIYLSNPG